MVQIRLDGYTVDLKPDTSLTLERFNPLLHFTSFPGSLVYSFTLPATPTNRRVLGYFEHPQASYTNRKYFCEKYVDGQLQERGYAKIQEVKNGDYYLFFSQNLSQAFGDLQQVPLSEIDFGTVPIAPALGNADVCWPRIENPALYGNQGVGGYTGLMNDWQGGSLPAVGRVPMPFVKWVLQQYGGKTGWQFTGQFMDDPDLARLLFYNLYTLDGLNALTYANHLPNLTMPQTLLGLRQLLNLFVEFDVARKICTMDFAEDVLAGRLDIGGAVVDWSAKVATGGAKQPDLQNRLELSYEIDSNDALLKPVPAPMDKYITPETAANQGGGLLPIRSIFSTLPTNPVSGLAQTSQAGVSPNNKDNRNEARPRLVFHNGTVNGGAVATHAQGRYRLEYQGPNNLVSTSYRRFEQFKANTYLQKANVFLTPSDLALFSFRNRVQVKGVQYVVGSLKVALKADARIIPGEVDLWRV